MPLEIHLCDNDKRIKLKYLTKFELSDYASKIK